MQSLRRDGVNLFYEETAGGDPPILFVHGWCCDHTYFAPQFERFAERGHSSPTSSTARPWARATSASLNCPSRSIP
jgi:pimeloyl-ACP methyl ester carboxylesterase